MSRPSRAEELYAEYLIRRESGEAPDFEELCAAHSDLAEDLKLLEAGSDALLAVRRGSLIERLKRAWGAGIQPALELDPEPAFWFKHHVRASRMDALGFAWTARWLGGDVVLSDEHDRLLWVPVATFDPSTWFSAHLLGAVERFLAGRR